MDRRALLIAVASSIVAMPLAAWAQTSEIPVIGYLGSLSSGTNNPQVLPGFRAGLAEMGYVEGKNRRNRIPLGGGSLRSSARAGGRSG